MMRRGNEIINGKSLDLKTFANYLVNLNEDQEFKTIFFSVFPVKGKIDWVKAKMTAIILAKNYLITIYCFQFYCTSN